MFFIIKNITVDANYIIHQNRSEVDYNTQNKNLTNRLNNLRNIQTFLKRQLAINDIIDLKENLNELNYEFKSLNKDKEIIQSE